MPRDEYQTIVHDRVYNILREQPLGLNAKLVEHYFVASMESAPILGLRSEGLYQRIVRSLKILVSSGLVKQDGTRYTIIQKDINLGVSLILKQMKEQMPYVFEDKAGLLAAFDSALQKDCGIEEGHSPTPKIGGALKKFDIG